MLINQIHSLYTYGRFNLHRILETNMTIITSNRTLSSKKSHLYSNQDDSAQSLFELPIMIQILIYMLCAAVIGGIFITIWKLCNYYSKKEKQIEKREEKKENKDKSIEMTSAKNKKEGCHINLNELDYL